MICERQRESKQTHPHYLTNRFQVSLFIVPDGSSNCVISWLSLKCALSKRIFPPGEVSNMKPKSIWTSLPTLHWHVHQHWLYFYTIYLIILERPSYGFQENYIGNEIKQENTKFRFVMLHREINQTKLRYYHKSQFTLKKSGQKIKHTCQKEDSHCAYPLVEVKGWQLHNQRC